MIVAYVLMGLKDIATHYPMADNKSIKKLYLTNEVQKLKVVNVGNSKYLCILLMAKLLHSVFIV